MKNVMKIVQNVALVIFALSIVLASFVPGMYYVTAVAMLVMAISAILEPTKEVGCPKVFTLSYREQFKKSA